jgi:hypothetical protein
MSSFTSAFSIAHTRRDVILRALLHEIETLLLQKTPTYTPGEGRIIVENAGLS